jgi:hypothetical protein
VVWKNPGLSPVGLEMVRLNPERDPGESGKSEGVPVLAAKLKGKVYGDGRISGVIDGVIGEGDKEGESARKRREASGVEGP